MNIILQLNHILLWLHCFRIATNYISNSNNFELSIAVAISLYGNGSRQAIASTYGPLLEVPILLILCFVAKYFKVKFIWADIKD